MMGGNPSWWSMHTELRSSTTSSSDDPNNLMFAQTHPSNTPLFPIPSSNSSSSSLAHHHHHHHHHHHAQDFPSSWSQLLLRGLGSEEERYGNGESVLESTRVISKGEGDVKEEESRQSGKKSNSFYGFHNEEDESGNWSQAMGVSSPRSCVTSLSSTNNNILDFSTNTKRSLHQQPHHSNSKSNSNSTGELLKKPKAQSSSIPALKVRKEKLGDRITALHQLVSPFGKTDTASVLLEAIGYIRFLQAQIQALSSPYLANNDNNASVKNQHSLEFQQVHGERNNCLFPDHPGQLLNDTFIKRRVAANNQEEEKKDGIRDLSSKGLCLVPISCTHLVGSDSGADYWAQSVGAPF